MAPICEIGKLTLKAIWALMLPLGIILALRIGAVTATEAGAVVCDLFYHHWRVRLPRTEVENMYGRLSMESLYGTGIVMILICCASPLGYFMDI